MRERGEGGRKRGGEGGREGGKERERDYACTIIHVSYCKLISVCRSLPVITVTVNMRVDAPTPVALDSTYVIL